MNLERKMQGYSVFKTAEHGHPDQNGDLTRVLQETIQLADSIQDLNLSISQELSWDKDYSFYYDIPMRSESKNLIFYLLLKSQSQFLEFIKKLSFEELAGCRDERGNTLLHLACYRGYEDVVRELLAKSQDVGVLLNARDVEGTNPLGMTFLNLELLKEQSKILSIAKFFIGAADYDVNAYLNNKVGMDSQTTGALLDIGGFYKIHVI